MPFHPTHLAVRAVRCLTLASVPLLFAGCQGIADSAVSTTEVRFIDASPDTPGLDLYQGAVPTLYNLGFGTVSSYIPNAPGPYTFSADTVHTQQQLTSMRGTIAAGGQYTVLVGNVSASLQMTLLRDQATPAPSGQVALRVVDQATRIGALDLYLLASGARLATGSPFLTNIGFGNAPAYVNAPDGTYSLVALPAGTVPRAATTPLYTGNQVKYPGGAARTLILIDQPTSPAPGLQVLTLDDFDSPEAAS